MMEALTPAAGRAETSRGAIWPALPLSEWADTYATLHMWTQVVGKVRLALAPMMNHWWQAPLYVTVRGLTTSPMPYGSESCSIDFDFIDHKLRMETSAGASRTLDLAPRSVAAFYREVMDALNSMDIHPRIWPVPVEVAEPIPFEQDHAHASYDPDYANRHWRILRQASRVLTEFRARFTGKSSPVHFFWGSFDLSVSRFSGRRAPRHPSVPVMSDRITVPAYSHEVCSVGFWPGGYGFADPAFFSYIYPTPAGYAEARVEPKAAVFSPALGEFLLPYEAVRTAEDPDATLLTFAQSAYEAAANLAGWDRETLEDRTCLEWVPETATL
ncbi:MAG TPA: DUF5996 family protein [Armatimonadota bacterium]|jgi:hypothetical protein